MIFQSKYALAAATFATAFGAGYIMQNGDSLSAFFTGENIAPDSVQLASASIPLTTATDASSVMQVPRLTAATLEPVPRLPNPGSLVRAGSADRVLPRADSTERSAFGMECDVTFGVTKSAAAMAALSISAPCHLDERVVITHEGLTFAVQTSNTGTLDVSVPVLATDASFTVRFADGSFHTADLIVDELREYDRVALNWTGRGAFHIHALEFGAAYGDTGHVSAVTPRSADTAGGRGGFLTQLGDPIIENPVLAEVYTFPTHGTRRYGVVRLNVEAEINAYTCEKDVDARALQLNAGVTPQWVDLTLAMPGCDAIGDFLVLKNLLRDLKIAQN